MQGIEHMLAGARDGGLFRSEGRTLSAFPLGESFDQLPISAIHRVGDTLWLGGLGGEILRQDAGAWRVLSHFRCRLPAQRGVCGGAPGRKHDRPAEDHLDEVTLRLKKS